MSVNCWVFASLPTLHSIRLRFKILQRRHILETIAGSSWILSWSIRSSFFHSFFLHFLKGSCSLDKNVVSKHRLLHFLGLEDLLLLRSCDGVGHGSHLGGTIFGVLMWVLTKVSPMVGKGVVISDPHSAAPGVAVIVRARCWFQFHFR